eukprot:symbB.v1.2.033916.t1/scaffold4282.1/size42006/1
MATFFFSLSLRASQQVLGVEDPLHCWVLKLILPCEVASALLIVQLGAFTHPLVGLLVFLLLLLMGTCNSWRKEGKNVSGAYAYRMSVHTQHGVQSSFASELSVLEPDRNFPTLLWPVFVRVSFSLSMFFTLQKFILGPIDEISSSDSSDAFYASFRVAVIFLPHVAVCLLVLLFLNYARILFCDCGDVPDDDDGRDEEDAAATLRKKIRRKAEALKANQESGSLGPLFWGRRSLELKLSIFAVDILMDCWCCWQYIESMSYFFAACQGAIIVVSSMVQFFRVRGHSLSQELAASWASGMPTDLIFRVLLVEKAVEAPLSLCLQYFSAFHLTDNLQALVFLICSMMLSILSISEGRYLSIMLWDLAKQDRQPKSADPEQATDPNQSVLPKYPPGLLPKYPPGLSLLPPPPATPRKDPPEMPPLPGMASLPKDPLQIAPLTGMASLPKDQPGMLPPPPGMASKIGSPQAPLPPIQLDGQGIKDTE